MPQSALTPTIVGGVTITGRGSKTILNNTAAKVIKATPGRICRAVVIAGGTAANGAFSINDCATVAAAAAANLVWSLPSGATAGSTFEIDFPTTVGIVLSAVPTAGSPIINFSFV